MSAANRRGAIIIGAGHNGLVTACYLARAGLRVLVLERRYLVGGACVTEETFPGFKISTAAYVNSLFRKEIVRDLRLGDYGFAVLPRSPSSFTPLPDGRSLTLGPDAGLTRAEIAKFSARDAARYPEYEAMLERVAAFVEPTLGMTPPDLLRPGPRGLLQLLGLGRSFARLGDGASEAVARAARDLGVEIRCEAPVARITVRDGRVTGVVLESGEECRARVVASNADAHVTFLRLLAPEVLSPAFRDAVSRISYESASLKINVALSELPSFTACPGGAPGPQHRGTIHICPDLDYIEPASDDAKYGRPSARPVLECTIPSVVDPTVAPPGRHLMSIFVQYAPYALRGTTWDQIGEAFADRCFALLDEYAPNFSRSVLARQVLTPLDIERVFGLTGGNIFQGAMTPGQLFSLRPLPGHAGYQTPVAGLYLCGAAAHPGGGVMGSPGWNAAREILRRRWRFLTT